MEDGKRSKSAPYRLNSRMSLRLGKEYWELVNGFQGCVPAKQC